MCARDDGGREEDKEVEVEVEEEEMVHKTREADLV